MGGGGGGKGGGGGGFGDMSAAITQAAQIQAEMSQKALDVMSKQYDQSRSDFSKYYLQSRNDLLTSTDLSQRALTGATRAGVQSLLGGQQQARAYLQPYANVGLPALDMLADTLGVSRPSQGSLDTFNNQLKAADQYQNQQLGQYDEYKKQLDQYNLDKLSLNNKLAELNIGQGGSGTDKAKGLELPYKMTRESFNQAVAGLPGQGGDYVYDPATGYATRAGKDATSLQGLKDLVKEMQYHATVPNQYGELSDSDYQKVLASNDPYEVIDAVKRYYQTFDTVGISGNFTQRAKDAIAAYRPAQAAESKFIGKDPTAPTAPTFTAPTTAPTPEMTAQGSQTNNALKNFYNTSEYQLLYGGSHTDLSTQSLEQRFAKDPGYLFQLEQGKKAIANNAAAKGYLNSPRYIQELEQFNQGMAGNRFDNYRTGLQSTFQAYQSKLAGMAGMGQEAMGAGANLAAQTGTNVGNLISGAGGVTANLTSGVGSNLAGVAQNQGANLGNLATNYGNNVASQYNKMGDDRANAYLAQGQNDMMKSQYEASQPGFFGTAGGILGMGAGFGSAMQGWNTGGSLLKKWFS